MCPFFAPKGTRPIGETNMTDQNQNAGASQAQKPAAKSKADAKAKRTAKIAAKKESRKVARRQKLDATEMKRLGLDPKPYGRIKAAS